MTSGALAAPKRFVLSILHHKLPWLCQHLQDLGVDCSTTISVHYEIKMSFRLSTMISSLSLPRILRQIVISFVIIHFKAYCCFILYSRWISQLASSANLLHQATSMTLSPNSSRFLIYQYNFRGGYKFNSQSPLYFTCTLLLSLLCHSYAFLYKGSPLIQFIQSLIHILSVFLV